MHELQFVRNPLTFPVQNRHQNRMHNSKQRYYHIHDSTTNGATVHRKNEGR